MTSVIVRRDEATALHQHISLFLKTQSRERYCGFVLHGPAWQGKTNFVRRLCNRSPGSLYLDILHLVQSSPALAEHPDLIDPPEIRDLVLAQAHQTHASLVIVDELDFLVNIWPEDLVHFKRMVEGLHCHYLPVSIGFVLQTRPALEEWRLFNTLGNSRLLRFVDLMKL